MSDTEILYLDLSSHDDDVCILSISEVIDLISPMSILHYSSSEPFDNMEWEAPSFSPILPKSPMSPVSPFQNEAINSNYDKLLKTLCGTVSTCSVITENIPPEFSSNDRRLVRATVSTLLDYYYSNQANKAFERDAIASPENETQVESPNSKPAISIQAESSAKISQSEDVVLLAEAVNVAATIDTEAAPTPPIHAKNSDQTQAAEFPLLNNDILLAEPVNVATVVDKTKASASAQVDSSKKPPATAASPSDALQIMPPYATTTADKSESAGKVDERRDQPNASNEMAATSTASSSTESGFIISKNRLSTFNQFVCAFHTTKTFETVEKFCDHWTEQHQQLPIRFKVMFEVYCFYCFKPLKWHKICEHFHEHRDQKDLQLTIVSKENSRSCGQCSFKANKRAALLEHSKQMHPYTKSDIDPTKNASNDLYLTDSLFDQVMAVDYSIPRQCELCNEVFATEKLYKSHHSAQHTIENERFKLLNDPVVQFSCSRCREIMPDEYQMIRHIWDHNGARKFYCERCGATLDSLQFLETHHRSKHSNSSISYRIVVTTAYFEEMKIVLANGFNCEKKQAKGTRFGSMNVVRNVVNALKEDKRNSFKLNMAKKGMHVLSQSESDSEWKDDDPMEPSTSGSQPESASQPPPQMSINNTSTWRFPPKKMSVSKTKGCGSESESKKKSQLQPYKRKYNFRKRLPARIANYNDDSYTSSDTEPFETDGSEDELN